MSTNEMMHSIEELDLKHKLAMFEKIYLSSSMKDWRISSHPSKPEYIVKFNSARGDLFSITLQESEISGLSAQDFNWLVLGKLEQSIVTRFIDYPEPSEGQGKVA